MNSDRVLGLIWISVACCLFSAVFALAIADTPWWPLPVVSSVLNLFSAFVQAWVGYPRWVRREVAAHQDRIRRLERELGVA